MPVRLLRYMVRIWDDYLQAHPAAKALPAVGGAPQRERLASADALRAARRSG